MTNKQNGERGETEAGGKGEDGERGQARRWGTEKERRQMQYEI